jgi:hypothetical protein
MNNQTLKRTGKFTVGIALLISCGCATIHMSTLPGETIADNSLKWDIYRTINIFESGLTGCTYTPAGLKVVDTRLTQAPGPSVDGRWVEIWVVKRGKANVEYIVTLRPSPQGGTDIQVTSPPKTP